MKVCPLPNKWAQIYTELESEWRIKGLEGPPPPKPLILAGWNFSNDVEKKNRWTKTIEWAKSKGLEHIVNQLETSGYYIVDELDNSSVIPNGGYYARWDSKPKPKPTKEEVKQAFSNLKENWKIIAGEDLASITQPIEFTGSKYRRLVVSVKSGSVPPWGDWQSLAKSENPNTFTHFRKSVNEAIDPVYVDHIDFIFKR